MALVMRFPPSVFCHAQCYSQQRSGALCRVWFDIDQLTTGHPSQKFP